MVILLPWCFYIIYTYNSKTKVVTGQKVKKAPRESNSLILLKIDHMVFTTSNSEYNILQVKRIDGAQMRVEKVLTRVKKSNYIAMPVTDSGLVSSNNSRYVQFNKNICRDMEPQVIPGVLKKKDTQDLDI